MTIKTAVRAVVERWTRAHHDALRYFSPPRLRTTSSSSPPPSSSSSSSSPSSSSAEEQEQEQAVHVAGPHQPQPQQQDDLHQSGRRRKEGGGGGGGGKSTAAAASAAADAEDQEMKAHALINLLLALAPLTVVFGVVVVLIDELTFLSDIILICLLSLGVYGGILWGFRRWGNLYVCALLLTLYLEHIVMLRAYIEGMHSGAYCWAVLLPQFVFYLLGARVGVSCLALTVLHMLLIYLHQLSPAAGGAAMLSMITDSAEGAPASSWIALSKSGQSPHALFLDRLVMFTVVGSIAYFNESRRSLGLRKVEEALREKEAVNAGLLQATEAKTHFLANMSHELRTPMHGIIAMASDLKEMPLTSKAREAIGIISDCADHLLSLVNDVLDFARIEQSQLELEQIPFCVTSEVKKALAMHSVMAKQKGVYLLVRKVRVSQPYHIGDPLRFRQIVINLLSNALKFTPGGGQVSLSLVNKKDKPDHIRVSVRDTGIGIPKSSQPHLFESFSQLDASIRRKYGGSGLGLSICKKLCAAMGGDITCTSEVGKGSEFSFFVSLPPTTKQNYREAREVDESARSRHPHHHPHQHHRFPHRHNRPRDDLGEEEEEDDELIQLESDFDEGVRQAKHATVRRDDSSSSDDDDDTEKETDSDSSENEADSEHDYMRAADRRIDSSAADDQLLTQSLTITPMRRQTMPNLFDGDDKNIEETNNNNNNNINDININDSINSKRRRSNTPGRGIIAMSAERFRQRSDSMRGLTQARRRSEGGTNLDNRAAHHQHSHYLMLNSSRGYVAESETDRDEDEASWFSGSSSNTSASSSQSGSRSLSRVSLTSPSSSFFSLNEIPFTTPPMETQSMKLASSMGSSLARPGFGSNNNSHIHQEPTSSDTDSSAPGSPVVDLHRRCSVPNFGTPAARRESSLLNEQHLSMPTIPSLHTASDSPLSSPTLLPLSMGYQATPLSSPHFESTSALSVLSSPSTASSAIAALATSSTRQVSLNSCSSPRGIVRRSPATQSSRSSSARQARVKHDGRPAQSSPLKRGIPPLNLAGLASSPCLSSSASDKPTTPLSSSSSSSLLSTTSSSSSLSSASPRSYYVPSFPLVSPRSEIRNSSPGPVRYGAEESQDVLRGKSVLIVEDNIINQKVALRMLSNFECKTTVAENGLVAIKLFEESCRERRKNNDEEPPYHAILMDIQMPFIDGFETAVRIREIEAQLKDGATNGDNHPDEREGAGQFHAPVPIIALTASATREYQQTCMAKGMNCFLSKPLKKETLIRTLVEVIQQAGYHDAALARRHAAEEEERIRQDRLMKRKRDELRIRRQRKAREEATMALALMMRRPMLGTTLAHSPEEDDVDDDDEHASRGRSLFRAPKRTRSHTRHNSIG